MTKTPLREKHPPIYSVKSYQPEASLGFLLGRCLNRVTDAIDTALAEHGINGQHFGVLRAIQRGTARNPSELARLRYQYSAAITYVLDVLEKKGLLVRNRSAEDRRVVELQLTPEGEALTRLCLPLVVQAQNQVIEGLDAADHQALCDLLGRIAYPDVE